MQETLYQTADAEVSLLDSHAGDTLSDSGRRRHSISQRMHDSLYQTADARDNGFRRHSIRQRMQKTLYKTTDAGDSLSES